MALPTGQISFSQVNTELGLSATTTISLNQASVRALAGVSSGQIAMSNLQGKSNISYFGTRLYPSNAPSGSGQFYVNTVSAFDSSGNVFTWGRVGDEPSGSTLVKVNSTGTVQWSRRIQNTGGNQLTATDIQIASSGNIYLLGFVNTYSTYCPIVVKYNSAGTIQWLNVYDQESYYPQAMVLDSTENIYFVTTGGNSYSANGGIVFKLNSAGTKQWSYAIKKDSDLAVGTYGIKLDSSGNIYTFSLATPAPNRGIVSKLSSTPTLLWTRALSGGTNNNNGMPTHGNCITIDSVGNVYIVSCNGTNWNLYVTKYNSSGTQQWCRELVLGSSALNTYTGGIQIDSSDNVYVCYSTNTGGVSGLAKYNSSGVIQWQRSFTTNGYFAQQFNVRSITVGTSISYMFGEDSGAPSGTSSRFIFKVPLDGSKTGTYTVGSNTVTYASTSYAEAAGTISTSTITGSISTFTSTPGTTAYSETSGGMLQQGPTAL